MAAFNFSFLLDPSSDVIVNLGTKISLRFEASPSSSCSMSSPEDYFCMSSIIHFYVAFSVRGRWRSNNENVYSKFKCAMKSLEALFFSHQFMWFQCHLSPILPRNPSTTRRSLVRSDWIEPQRLKINFFLSKKSSAILWIITWFIIIWYRVSGLDHSSTIDDDDDVVLRMSDLEPLNLSKKNSVLWQIRFFNDQNALRDVFSF